MFDWITSLMDSGGLLAVFGLMLGENVFPPIPSELVMPLAGFMAATGQLTLIGVFVAGVAGSVLGAWLWYWLGARLSEPRLRDLVRRHGFWLTLSEADLDKALAWFRRHGTTAVFLGRMVPGVRTLISLPAGLTGMRLTPFLLYTTAGSAVWCALLVAAGYILRANFTRVEGWLNPVTTALVIGLIAVYLYRVARGLWRGRSKKPDDAL